jgi:hypothetical protein
LKLISRIVPRRGGILRSLRPREQRSGGWLRSRDFPARNRLERVLFPEVPGPPAP